MCGIIGVISQESIENLIPNLQESCDVIRHRGPDDRGTEIFEKAYLGFRRLSIIDLSEKGHQPMPDNTKRYWIIFNGEVYNFKELRNQLVQKGYSFNSNTDTEVVLNGYIAYGEKIVEVIEGMFSFIIYDKTTHSFFAARDRVGKKPMLIYRQRSTTFLFSEIKQLISFPGFDKEVNFAAIINYLMYGSILQPDTILQNARCLPPGHFLTIKNGQVEIKQYWKTKFDLNNSITYGTAKERLRELVEASVKKRLISDVPLGAFLSGGIDSTIIVGLMRKFANSTINTFSINYENANVAFDESYYANLVAKRFNTQHHSIKIGPEDVSNDLDRIIWHMDQPSSDAINTYFVSLSARKGVTVALSGVGADELFAGYSTFRFANLASKFHKSVMHDGSFRTSLTKLFYKIPLRISSSWKVRGMFSLMGAFPRTVDRYNLIKQIYHPADITKLISHNILESEGIRVSPVDKYFDNDLTDIQKISNAEINGYLVSTLLRDADVMGMAHSLEIRAPFVDHKLIEFTGTLPDHFKIQGVKTKVILKETFNDVLPDEVIKRKKMGFSFPLTIWLKQGKLREIVEDCLSESSIKRRGWLNCKSVTDQKNNFFNLQSETPNSFQSYQRVWMLVVLELWARKFLDQ